MLCRILNSVVVYNNLRLLSARYLKTNIDCLQIEIIVSCSSNLNAKFLKFQNSRVYVNDLVFIKLSSGKKDHK